MIFDPDTAGINPTARWGDRANSTRRGLAPLELVLSLFFLLLMMALIINFGTISSWQARGDVAARWAVWRSIGLRTGTNYPNPPNWQVTGATMGRAPGLPVNPSLINQVWNQGDLTQAALRGQPLAPVITDPLTGNSFLMGNQQYMEMTNSAAVGAANLTRKMPLLPNMRQSNYQPLHPILDQANANLTVGVGKFWRFQDMYPGVPPNVNPNVYWAMRSSGARVYQWYQFEASQLSSINEDIADALGAFQMATQAIQQNPNSAALLPLDRDDELTAQYGPAPPDFYPRPQAQQQLCNGSPENVLTSIIPGLINRIKGPNGDGKRGVPAALANAFIQMYKQQQQTYQQQQPPNQQMVDQLQQKIDQLTGFP
jgi:hypothetical protein